MWPFKGNKGSEQESAAGGEYPDEAILQVGWDEFDKEADLEATSNLGTAVLGPLAIMAARPGRRKRDSDSVDEHGQRESLRDDNDKT